MKNWGFRLISCFISKMVQDSAIVTMEDEQELVCDLSSGVIFNDHERPQPIFQGHAKYITVQDRDIIRATMSN